MKRLEIRNGFTMVELVLVVGVLVILSAITLVALKVPQYRGQAHNVQRKTDIKSIHNAFLLLARDKDDYTSGLPTSPACIGTGSASAFNLKGISWTANPTSAAMKFNVRACADLSCSGNPAWSSDYSSPTSIDIPNASFFQYKAAFNAPENVWTQTANTDFNGTNTGTAVFDTNSAAKIILSIYGGTGANDSFDPSLGNVVGGCDANKGMTWNSPTLTCTINTSNAIYNGTYNFTTVNIPSGTTLTTSGTTNPLTINATGDVMITGSINLNGKGYGGGPINSSAAGSPGSGTGGGSGGSYPAPGKCGGGKGGGYGNSGGNGGTGSSGASGGTTLGAAYGSPTAPTNLGSGGGAGGSYLATGGAGGSGGGAIKIVASGAVTINGPITANGNNGVDYNGGSGGTDPAGGGGGSGGSIWIQASKLAGNQPINADGGTGGAGYIYNSVNYGGGGGGGSGGRIVLNYFVNNYIGSISSAGGNYYSQAYGYGQAGGPVTPISSAITVTAYASSGTYTSSIEDLLQPQTFTSISWNRTDTNDGEITLGDTNLKGLWHFNETAGTNATDSILVNNLTAAGATQSSPGKFGGRSLSFNGSAYAQKTSPTNLDIGVSDGSWTLEAWVKPSSAGSGTTRTIISKDGSAMHYYDLKLNTSNQVVAGLYDSDGDKAEATSNIISPSNWHHIVAIFTKSGSTGTVQIYIDGKRDGGLGSNMALPSNMSNTVAFRVGMRNDGTFGFNGEIDEAAFWSKALSSPANDCATDEPKISYDSYQYEICQHYNKGIGIPHLKFQARSCASSCTTETFVGPDGTAATYYNSIGNYGSGSSLNNLTANQYVQYKAYFATSDSSVTPSLDSISIKYSSLQISKPKLEDVTITASLDSAGKNQVSLLYSGYGDFVGGGTNLGQYDSNLLKILPEGYIEYQGGSNPEYISPVFSTQCYNIKQIPGFIPDYLPEIPKDPKIGTDENTGYFFSANPEMGTVTISAPAAELGEIIRN